MGEYFDQIREDVQEHIIDITKTSGLEDNSDSYEKMAEAWLEKKNAFESNIQSLGMEEITSFDKSDEKGAIVLTYSGSLINVGPVIDGARSIDYTSIGLRSDVPDSISSEDSILATDIEVDEKMEFEKGPVKSTSSIFKIAVCNDDVSLEDQEETLDKATLLLSDEFTRINRTLIQSDDE